MRIALVIERFDPAAGGAERAAWTVAHGLADAGEEVHAIARAGADSPRVRLHTTGSPAGWQPLRVLAFSRAAAHLAGRLGCDVVHSFSRTRHQDVYRAGGGSHADYMEHAYGPAGRRLRRLSPRHAVLLALERRIFADPRQWIQCNAPMVAREIARRYPVPESRLVVIPNGVDAERFHPRRRSVEGARLRAELGAGPGPVYALVGSGLERKGLATALAALARGGPAEAQLWVAARDPVGPWERRARAAGVARRVRFLGERRDVEAVYAAADLLLLPTRYDSAANACLEAAAAGLPVVTSAANGAAELLGAGVRVVADPRDADGFAAALDALADPAVREAQGRAARRAAEALSWAAHVEALRALYRRVAG